MTSVLSSDNELKELLQSVRTIAVVGLSDDPDRPSFGVAKYLLKAGYEVVPVNPYIDEWQGIPAYPTVEAIGRYVDLVDVFRRPDFLLGVVEDAITAGSGAVWTQLGVIDEQAVRRAETVGMPIVVDRCMAIEHRRLIANAGQVQ